MVDLKRLPRDIGRAEYATRSRFAQHGEGEAASKSAWVKGLPKMKVKSNTFQKLPSVARVSIPVEGRPGSDAT